MYNTTYITSRKQSHQITIQIQSKYQIATNYHLTHSPEISAVFHIGQRKRENKPDTISAKKIHYTHTKAKCWNRLAPLQVRWHFENVENPTPRGVKVARVEIFALCFAWGFTISCVNNLDVRCVGEKSSHVNTYQRHLWKINVKW